MYGRGIISANGGKGGYSVNKCTGGSGGGGRILIDSNFIDPNLKIEAKGGGSIPNDGSKCGGAGSIYLKKTNAVIFDGDSTDGTTCATTTLPEKTPHSVEVKGGAVLYLLKSNSQMDGGYLKLEVMIPKKYLKTK